MVIEKVSYDDDDGDFLLHLFQVAQIVANYMGKDQVEEVEPLTWL